VENALCSHYAILRHLAAGFVTPWGCAARPRVRNSRAFPVSYSNEHFCTFTLKVVVQLWQSGTYKYHHVIYKLVPLCDKMQRLCRTSCFCCCF